MDDVGSDSRHVLVADDDPSARRLFERLLGMHGYRVSTAVDGEAAREMVCKTRFDVVLSDISMPGLNGLQLLQAIRAYDPDVPVLLITGEPRLDTAMQAVQFGAVRYLTKPADGAELLEAVAEAVRLCVAARARRGELTQRAESRGSAVDEVGLQAAFAEALGVMFLVFQPIVQMSRRRVFGYEALLRTRSKVLPDPGRVFDAAERLGRTALVGQRVRSAVVEALRSEKPPGVVFVNLHPHDLLDPELLSRDSLLTEYADRVVLEVTERASLDAIDGVADRMGRLRQLGFRVAVDDLGAGYAGLTSFLRLSPDIVKIDMELVRGIDQSDAKRKLVRSVVDLCKELEILVVAEGIETRAERDTVVHLGVDLLQGFGLGRPHAIPQEVSPDALAS